jgi:serine beta-lactamase-like protein LACTB
VLTLRQLLAHTSGLRDYRSGEWLPVSRVHCGTAREALAPFRDDPLLFTPGTSARYTSYGYVLASAVLEEHAGRPFYELLKSEVLAPSGATGLRPDSPADEAPARSAYYEAALFGRVRPAVAVDNSCKLGAGGLLGSVTDLAAFGTALLGGRLLSPAGLAEMLRPVAVSGGETTDSGLGLSLAQLGGATVGVQSGGAIGGRSYLLLDPQRHVVIALASNLEGERLGEEARRLHAAFSGR